MFGGSEMDYFFAKGQRRRWKPKGRSFSIGKQYFDCFECIYDDLSVEVINGYIIGHFSEAVVQK